MELQEFIRKTLCDIHAAVKETNQSLKDPAFFLSGGKEGAVDFDVAITVTEGNKAEGGGGIKVVALNIGGSKEVSSVQENISRIKFTIQPNGDVS